MSFDSPGPIRSVTQITDWALDNQPSPPQKTDKTWYRTESISSGKWNALYPYELLVVDQSSDGSYSVRKDPQGSWTFVLPIPPESLSISMPFAIQTSVTFGGYVEEHNGAPIRMLNITGTTGVSFGRDSAPVPPAFDFRNSVFAGTLNAANNTKNSAIQLVQPTFVSNVHAQTEYDVVTGQGSLTGYYQFRLLQQFFESYAEMKKTKAGRRARLAFATWKDEAVYLVQPIIFDVKKDAGSPLEYRYAMSFKATKRVKLQKGAVDVVHDYVPVQNNPGALTRMLNTLQQVRVVLQGAKKTIAAVGGDVERGIFEPIRQTTLLVKDILSVPLSVADLADSLIQDMKLAVVQSLSATHAVLDFPENEARRRQQVTRNAKHVFDDVHQLAGEQSDDVRTSPLVAAFRAAHPANSAFANPSDNFDFFSLIPVGSLNLSPQLTGKVAAERNRVRRLTRLDFQKMRDSIQAASDAFANAVNAGGATYNATYSVTPPAHTIVEEPSQDDFNTMFAMDQLIMEMSRLAVTSQDDPKLNSIAAVAGLAARSGIAFQIPRSKYGVPFPHGITMEGLALRYLGDPNRWMEIATLNGLQAPYIDEEGFQLPLLVNGANNQVLVSNATHLFAGQPVWIGSDTVARTRRTITKVDKLASSQVLVTVDGTADLDRYVTPAHARLEAFLPNTVNSQMLVYIPSDIEPKDEDFTSRGIPGIDEHDALIAVGGIDLLLTGKNDLVVTEDGDSRWAVGITNITQKVRIAFSVVQGTLYGHPQYGLPQMAGQSLADFSAVDVARAAQSMFAEDPTFAGVKAASIDISGPVGNLSVALQVAGTQQVIPITAEVNR